MPAEVHVVDPRHPLYERSFLLATILPTPCVGLCTRVEWRFGLTLVLPISVTSLCPREEQSAKPTKLSVEALEDLVATAEGSEGECPSSLGTSGAAGRPQPAGRSSTISPPSYGR